MAALKLSLIHIITFAPYIRKVCLVELWCLNHAGKNIKKACRLNSWELIGALHVPNSSHLHYLA